MNTNLLKKNEIFYDRDNNTISVYDGSSQNISNLKLLGIINISDETVILKKNEVGYNGTSLRIGDGINTYDLLPSIGAGETGIFNYELIVDSSTTVNQQSADGSSNKPFKTISNAVNYISDVANNVIINIVGATYREESEIIISKNINNLTIQPNLSGTNVIISCTQSDTRKSLIKFEGIRSVNINNITFTRNDSSSENTNTSCIEINQCNFNINSCIFENSYNGVITSLSNGYIKNCNFENLYCAVNSTTASKIQMINNLGDDSTENISYVVICDGSIVFCDNDISLAGSENYYLIQNDGKVIIKGTDIYSSIVSDQYYESSGYTVSYYDSVGKNSYRVTLIS